MEFYDYQYRKTSYLLGRMIDALGAKHETTNKYYMVYLQACVSYIGAIVSPSNLKKNVNAEGKLLGRKREMLGFLNWGHLREKPYEIVRKGDNDVFSRLDRVPAGFRPMTGVSLKLGDREHTMAQVQQIICKEISARFANIADQQAALDNVGNYCRRLSRCFRDATTVRKNEMLVRLPMPIKKPRLKGKRVKRQFEDYTGPITGDSVPPELQGPQVVKTNVDYDWAKRNGVFKVDGASPHLALASKWKGFETPQHSNRLGDFAEYYCYRKAGLQFESAAKEIVAAQNRQDPNIFPLAAPQGSIGGWQEFINRVVAASNASGMHHHQRPICMPQMFDSAEIDAMKDVDYHNECNSHFDRTTSGDAVGHGPFTEFSLAGVLCSDRNIIKHVFGAEVSYTKSMDEKAVYRPTRFLMGDRITAAYGQEVLRNPGKGPCATAEVRHKYLNMCKGAVGAAKVEDQLASEIDLEEDVNTVDLTFIDNEKNITKVTIPLSHKGVTSRSQAEEDLRIAQRNIFKEAAKSTKPAPRKAVSSGIASSYRLKEPRWYPYVLIESLKPIIQNGRIDVWKNEKPDNEKALSELLALLKGDRKAHFEETLKKKFTDQGLGAEMEAAYTEYLNGLKADCTFFQEQAIGPMSPFAVNRAKAAKRKYEPLPADGKVKLINLAGCLETTVEGMDIIYQNDPVEGGFLPLASCVIPAEAKIWKEAAAMWNTGKTRDATKHFFEGGFARHHKQNLAYATLVKNKWGADEMEVGDQPVAAAVV